jgi:hypothetical protein
MELRRTEVQCRAGILSFTDGEEARWKPLMDTLMKRVDELVQHGKPQLENVR